MALSSQRHDFASTSDTWKSGHVIRTNSSSSWLISRREKSKISLPMRVRALRWSNSADWVASMGGPLAPSSSRLSREAPTQRKPSERGPTRSPKLGIRVRMAIAGKQEWPPLLPWGLHPMTLADVRNLCVVRFPDSITRSGIMDGLEAVVTEVNKSGLPLEIWVNGSFLTEKLNPEDSDIVAKFDGVAFDAAQPEQQARIAWLNSNLKNHFKCDSYVFPDYPKGHPAHDSDMGDVYWRAKFGFSRGENAKGLAVLKLPFIIT